MRGDTEDALSGRPKTIEGVDLRGRPFYRITVLELTAFRALCRDKARIGLFLAMVAMAFAVVWTHNSPWTDDQAITAIVSWLVLLALLYPLVSFLFLRKTTIVMTQDRVSFIWLTGRREFALEEVHGFDFCRHYEKAWLPGHYFESFHIRLSHEGQERIIFDVLGAIEAKVIVERLKLCYRYINDWKSSPGDLRDTDDEDD